MYAYDVPLMAGNKVPNSESVNPATIGTERVSDIQHFPEPEQSPLKVAPLHEDTEHLIF